VTACTAFAQKQLKVVQTGYAPPFRSGSKLLLKFCGTECEQFNRKVYATLDLVKKFENKYKLADPKSITTNPDYNTYRPIALIAWLQEEHTDFVTDHKWPALATNFRRATMHREQVRNLAVASIPIRELATSATRLGTFSPTAHIKMANKKMLTEEQSLTQQMLNRPISMSINRWPHGSISSPKILPKLTGMRMARNGSFVLTVHANQQRKRDILH
jgi:hypothetical protein